MSWSHCSGEGPPENHIITAMPEVRSIVSGAQLARRVQMSDPRLDRATSRIFKDRYVIFLKSCLMRCWAMLIDMAKGDALANIACCWPLMVSMALCTSGCVVVFYLSARETTATAYSMFSGNKIFQSELMRHMS